MARIRRYLGRVEVFLDSEERAAVLATVDALAAGDTDGPWLQPRGYDDPDLDGEYQRLTGPELEAVHEADLGAMREDLARNQDRCRLDDERALAWLRALNRLRLVAGARLGIEADGWEETIAAAALERDEFAMLNDLSWLQEGLLRALEPSL